VEFVVPKWLKTDLSYNISKYPKSLQELGRSEAVDNEFNKAFALWSNITKFNFTRALAGSVEIDIKFENGDEWDGHELRKTQGVDEHEKDTVACTSKDLTHEILYKVTLFGSKPFLVIILSPKRTTVRLFSM